MNLHKHARLTPRGRALLVQRILEHGLRVEEAAHASGVSVRTAYKWLARYRRLGEDGLQDRSSRPQRCPHATPPELVEQILQQRQQRSTYGQIAAHLQVGQSTIARIVRRAGLHRLAELEPRPPVVRYQYPEPGGMLHLDIKKLGCFRQAGHRVTGDRAQASRGAGWEYVHVAIDDHSRVAFSSLLPDESGRSACRALIAAVRYYRSLGVTFQRVLTDNGACYRSKVFARTSGAFTSGTTAPAPTLHAPTARQSVSSRRHCVSGPMPTATTAPSNVPPTCRTGSITTTGIGHMPALDTDLPPPGSTSH